jgi:O-antigen ligase
MLSEKIGPRAFFGEQIWLSVFYAFGVLILSALFVSIYTENYYLLLIPPALLFVLLSIYDLKFIYFVLLFTIPLSIEVQLPNGFATDFPTEILIGGMMILFIVYVLSNPGAFDIRFLKHPLIFLVLLYYSWAWVATIYSSNAFVSVKYSLAKTWYIITFVFATALMIKSVEDFKKAFWLLLVPLLFTIVYTLIRHAKTGFSFQTVNTPMLPFFRNHVNYACTIAEMVPFTILAITWYKKGTFKRLFLIASLLLMLVAVYFSYTRSAWLALLTAGLMIIVIRLNLTRWSLILAFAGITGFFLYMGYHDHYLTHAPDFETTIYHPELGEHLTSTFEGKDISSAERIYRWVAGIRMWAHEPWIGYGPGNFNNFYKSYTVNSFRTYVSDNPERSSIHNYFLLMLTEQGVIGLLIFLLLTVGILINGQRIYNQTINRDERRYVLGILLCIIVIYANTFLSDLLETDKIGSFYFICIALLVNQDIRNKELDQKSVPADLSS